MPFHDPVSLGELRQVVGDDLPHRATLAALVESTGAGGVTTQVVTTIRSNVACRLSLVTVPKTTTETMGQVVPSGATWQVWFRVFENLTGVERVTVTGRDDNEQFFTRSLNILRPDVPVTDGMRRILYAADL